MALKDDGGGRGEEVDEESEEEENCAVLSSVADSNAVMEQRTSSNRSREFNVKVTHLFG